MKSKKTLSNKEKRQLQIELTSLYGDEISLFFQKSTILQSVKTDEGSFIVKEGKIHWLLHNEKYLPSIHFLRETGIKLSKIVVDIGAIRFITNGADVMAPGIVSFDNSVKKGSLVEIREEKANTIIGVGMSLINSDEFDKNKKGKVIKLIHHLKDKFWLAKF